jgi:hypothetical protein
MAWTVTSSPSVARLFFRSMDMLAGKETTLAKAKLVEALAPIPHRVR